MSDKRTCTRCGETKPLTDFPLDRGKSRARCKRCHTADAIAYVNTHREERRAYHREYMRKRREDMRPPGWAPKRAPAKTEEERLARRLASIQRSRERFRPKMAQARKAWATKNPHKVAEKTRRYQAAKRRAVCGWANSEIMALFYAIAQAYSAQTGYAFEVDHFVPLNSDKVCGLHVEHNLTVIERSVNREKSNRVWPDMPEG